MNNIDTKRLERDRNEQADREYIRDTIASTGKKLKAAFEGGPDSPDVELTPSEATVLYRILTEKLGMIL